MALRGGVNGVLDEEHRVTRPGVREAARKGGAFAGDLLTMWSMVRALFFRS